MKSGSDNAEREGHGRYLRIPSWASLSSRALAAPDAAASSVSIEIEKHRPIPVDEPITPEKLHGGGVVDGLCFDGIEPVEPGTILELQIAFQPDEPAISLRGEVVDSRVCDTDPGRYHTRVGFLAGSEAEVDVIAQFVKKFFG